MFFSWHEIGVYDVPAMIDYIINKTSHQKIFYVGHSQGGTSFYISMSMRPEYNEKIRLASLMAPAGFMGGKPAALYKTLGEHVTQVQVTHSIH